MCSVWPSPAHGPLFPLSWLLVPVLEHPPAPLMQQCIPGWRGAAAAAAAGVCARFSRHVGIEWERGLKQRCFDVLVPFHPGWEGSLFVCVLLRVVYPGEEKYRPLCV